MESDDLMKFAKETVKDAGEILMNVYKQISKPVHVMGEMDEMQTNEVEKASAKFITSEIKAKYPKHGIFSREDVPIHDENYVWEINSLDGKCNFMGKNPDFAVSMAAIYRLMNPKELRLKKDEHRGCLLAAAIYVPAHGLLYSASMDGGAYLETNEESMRLFASNNKKLFTIYLALDTLINKPDMNEVLNQIDKSDLIYMNFC